MASTRRIAPHSVPAHQVQRNWGRVSDEALRDPVVITARGRPRHVLMAFDEYERLMARDRRAYRVESLPDDLAEFLEAGLDELRDGAVDHGDTVIG
jgi:prevent-host-death family protein